MEAVGWDSVPTEWREQPKRATTQQIVSAKVIGEVLKAGSGRSPNLRAAREALSLNRFLGNALTGVFLFDMLRSRFLG